MVGYLTFYNGAAVISHDYVAAEDEDDMSAQAQYELGWLNINGSVCTSVDVDARPCFVDLNKTNVVKLLQPAFRFSLTPANLVYWAFTNNPWFETYGYPHATDYGTIELRAWLLKTFPTSSPRKTWSHGH